MTPESGLRMGCRIPTRFARWDPGGTPSCAPAEPPVSALTITYTVDAPREAQLARGGRTAPAQFGAGCDLVSVPL